MFNKNKMPGGIMGLIVGDALGVPYEFRNRDTFTASKMIGYGTYNQPPGTWSDDSSMVLATMDAINRCNSEINTKEIMRNFMDWFYNGWFTPYGKCFDVGNTTQKAITKYYSGVYDINSCGCGDVTDNGNGSLMRILPLAFMQNITNDDIDSVSAITHAHGISKYACEVYISFAQLLCNDMPINKVYDIVVTLMKNGTFNYRLGEEFMDFTKIPNLKRNDIKSTGYVVDTLIAAVWCLINTDNYKDCVLKAVNLGGDTDTIAAVAGGLAGIVYGIKGIPEEWLNKIPKKDEITEIMSVFYKVI